MEEVARRPGVACWGKLPAVQAVVLGETAETRLLILNPDPVFDDKTIEIVSRLDGLEMHIVRTLAEAVLLLLGENFDGLIVEGETALMVDQATSVRQHFPSLKIACVVTEALQDKQITQAEQQDIRLIASKPRRSEQELKRFVLSLEKSVTTPAEGIDPCHSLIGNLNQFNAAEILQMSCLSQRSGRFMFKSGRGNCEVYLQHGAVRHAVFGPLQGEAAVAEVFRWRQGRFYFEEGIISQAQSVDRPWAHLLIENLQKFDETLELAAAPSQTP